MVELAKDILSGRAKGITPSVVRGITAVAEPIYATVMRLRNVAFDLGWKKSYDAPVPVISIGNLTTGGTGKTPVVAWLARALRKANLHPAVLMRGYKAVAGEKGDEQLLLEVMLNSQSDADSERIPVHANADRVAGALEIIRDDPSIQAIILDDGFQHRRLRRVFDLVLIDATFPFGFDHVLPRGFLREPPRGLERANGVLLTRVDMVSSDVIQSIEQRVRQLNPAIPIFKSRHVQSPPRIDGVAIDPANKSGFAFCGIGNPKSFFEQLKMNGLHLTSEIALDDHQAYDRNDYDDLRRRALDSECDYLVTTEKDWMKLAQFRAEANSIPLATVGVEVQFDGEDESMLLAAIVHAI